MPYTCRVADDDLLVYVLRKFISWHSASWTRYRDVCVPQTSRWWAVTSCWGRDLGHCRHSRKSFKRGGNWKYVLLPPFSNSSSETLGYLTDPKPVYILRDELHFLCALTSIVALQLASLWSLPVFRALLSFPLPCLRRGGGAWGSELLLSCRSLLPSDLSECLLYLGLHRLITHSVFGFKGYQCPFSWLICIPLFSEFSSSLVVQHCFSLLCFLFCVKHSCFLMHHTFFFSYLFDFLCWLLQMVEL